MELEYIIAPSLNSTEYGQGIVEVVENINKNFNMLNNPAFEKGDDAAPVKSTIVDLEEQTISDIDSGLSQNILGGINGIINEKLKNCKFSRFNMYYNDLEIPKERYIFSDFIKKYLLGFSPLYVYDEEYYRLREYSDETINRTGAYTIQYDGGFTLEELKGYPKLNFIENKWVWQIDSLYIDTQGAKGADGRPGSTYFVVVDKDNIIEEINGQKPQETTQYIGQVAFALDETDKKTILIGYIEVSDGKLIFKKTASLTSEFTDKNFLECLSHIGNSNASPGLFVPIDKYDDGTGITPEDQKVHMIYTGDDADLKITPAKLTYKNNELSWNKKPLDTGNLSINYNTNISGNLTADSAKISTQLTTNSATIGETIINSDGITTNSAAISGELNVGTGITTESLESNTVVISKTAINSGGITTNSAAISGNLTADSAKISKNLKVGSINDVKIGKASIKTYIIAGENCRFKTKVDSDYTNVYWYVTCIKKNGWVKMTIRPTSDTQLVPGEVPSAVSTTYWDFKIFTDDTTQEWLKDGHNRSVKPVQISQSIVLDKEYMPLSNLWFCGTCEENISGWEDKPSFIKYVLLQDKGTLSLQMYYSDIYRHNGGKMADKHYYSPYIEFAYPTDD